MAIGAVALLVLLVVAEQLRQGGDAKPLPGPPLRELGEKRGVLIGSAVRADVLRHNRAYRQLVAAQFSSVTAENEMKWAVVEPERGEFDFEAADAIVDAAGKAGQAVRGHALIFHSQLAGWVGGLGRADLRDATEKHIRRVVDHYRGRVAVWDVVNEALTDRGALRRSPFAVKLGPGYIAQAFRTARRADPKARLHINEVGAEGINPKSDRLYALVRSLKARGVPVDGVGFQMHVNLVGVPPTFVANLRRFAALGVEVAITEADVGLRLVPSAADLRAQARVYATIVRGCLAVKACNSLTFWGFTDGRSWISETQPGMGAATLLDDELRPKPAFGAVQRALQP
ncbi:MAG: endo-1,4-beta-xylanase [Actinomycetota bacterium]|nr:endo-1,4-beta-xylanase [Actinomycetota bacterium]